MDQRWLAGSLMIKEMINASINGDAASMANLISRGVDVNHRDDYNWQAIHRAARGGHDRVIKLLLNTGRVDVNSFGYQNQTPLQYAICNKHISTIELLLRNKANCNVKSTFGDTPLHAIILRFARCCNESKFSLCEFSVKLKDCPLIWETFSYLPWKSKTTKKCVFVAIAVLMVTKYGADVSIRGKDGRTVMDRIRKDYIEYRWLSDYFDTFSKEKITVKKADEVENWRCPESSNSPVPNLAVGFTVKPEATECVNSLITSPLHAASYSGDLTEVKRLVFNGVNFHSKNGNGNCALHKAVEANRSQVLTYLIETGADVNATNDRKQSPLHVAVENASLECLEILLEKNCDINQQDMNGHTAIMNAVMKTEDADVFTKSRREQIIEMLIEGNAKLNLSSKNGLTCVHLAAKYGNEFAITRFAKCDKSSLTIKDKDGNQPLHHALIEGRNAVIDTLLKITGIGVDDVGISSLTPLHFAIIHRNFSTIELLVSKNANTNTHDDSGCTPLHFAFKGYNNCCARCISLDCIMKDLLSDSKQILEVFNSLPRNIGKRCIFLAVAQFLMNSGAQLLVKDKNGALPMGAITWQNEQSNIVISHFILLHLSNIQTFSDDISDITTTLNVLTENDCANFRHSNEEMQKIIADVEFVRSNNSYLLNEISSIRSSVENNEKVIKQWKCSPMTRTKSLSNGDHSAQSKDITAVLQSLLRKDSEIEKQKEEIAFLMSKINDKMIELQSLKERNDYLESLRYNEV